MKKVLLLGDRGKLGYALSLALANDFDVHGINHNDCDVSDFTQLDGLIYNNAPDIVINTVAYLGLDACEKQPRHAFRINTHLPHRLAELSSKMGFTLVHISTDSVFDNQKQQAHDEFDMPRPLNMYGATKYAADCLIQAIASKYYIFRIGVLFGPSPNKSQFVEKMLRLAWDGKEINVATDVITSPCYNVDIAAAIRTVLQGDLEFGLYHMVNEGSVSLHELMRYLLTKFGLEKNLKPASHHDFACYARKNVFTPLTSAKVPLLRPWTQAVDDYGQLILDAKVA